MPVWKSFSFIGFWPKHCLNQSYSAQMYVIDYLDVTKTRYYGGKAKPLKVS